ncbi:MAG: lipid II flippase MurJ [Candidatus Saccharimonadales bacterium]
MQITIPRSRKKITFGNAAMLLVATALVAQVMGFFRTKLVNANFNGVVNGVPIAPDQNAGVYFAAFVLPDFFFFTIAAGALGVAFIPYLSDRLHKGDRQGVWELSTSLVNFLCLFMVAVGAIMFIFADVLVRTVVAHGLTPDQQHNVALMIRILSFNPLLFTVSGVISAVQQVFGRFFFYAIAPLFYNACIIASLYIFKHNIGIVGLAIGAVVGAVMQLLVIMLGNYGLGFRWRPSINWQSDDFRSMLKALPPRSLDQGIDQVQGIVETNIASSPVVGGATAIGNFNSAYVLHTAPILLIGTAISTAIFPKLNTRLSQGRPDLFRQDFLKILRLMMWMALPIVVVSFFGRGYLARFIFTQNSQEITNIFGFLCVAILFRIMYTIISRWFYAQKDTRTPLFVSIFVIALNIMLSFTLARTWGYGAEGLAMAQSIVAATEVAVLGSIMLNRDRKLFDADFWGGVVKIISVTGFSIVTGFISVQFLPLIANDQGTTLLFKFSGIAAVTLTVHILISALFGLAEVRPLFDWLRRVSLRTIKVDY